MAFSASHPLAADGGVVLNLEARGSTGPVIMLETSQDNAKLVDVFSRAAPHPVCTSFAVEIHRALPNDTDFTAFLDQKFVGLNSAYIDGGAVYHTPLDTPAAVNQGSLYQYGDNALGLAREFGSSDLTALRAGDDATYFPVPGGLVRYPGWLTLPLALLTVLAVAVDDGYVGGFTSVEDDFLGLGKAKLRTGPAPVTYLPAPKVDVLADSTSGTERTLRLRLTPQRPPRLATLYVDTSTATVLRAKVAGRPVPIEPRKGKWGFGLVFHALPPEGFEVTLIVSPKGGPVVVRAMDASDGLDALPGFRPRQPDVGIVGSNRSDILAVARTYPL